MNRLRPFLLIVVFIVAADARGQSSQPNIVSSREAGAANPADEAFDIPELYGSRPFVSGSAEKLPAVLAEYAVSSGAVYERISIFDNGVVTIHVTGRGRDMRKQIIVSDEAMKIYREEVARLPIAELPRSEFTPTENVARLRIGRNGTTEERHFLAGTILPRQIANFRQLLTDLLDAIALDNQVTNPITTYIPQIGDKLISEDQKMYTVTRLLRDGTIVEVELAGKPTKMYVPTELLPKLFIDARVARREQ